MTALLQHRPRVRQATNHEQPNRVVLHDIPWEAYLTIADALPERRIRITYDRGEMEIMTVSTIHERFKSLFPVLLSAIAEVFGRNLNCFGSFTHRRKDLARALEPDQCFYLEHFGDVAGLREINLERDPPPDLAIEIEISRSILNRLGILAALGVPELWRFENESIQAYVLAEGKYLPRERSQAFPEVPLATLPRFLKIGLQEGEQRMTAAARKWARGLKRGRRKK